ncbi:MAG: M23 family metallopeptidase [Nitrospirae bacterium]|uniref:M23 family metallopeptidase n=1 Tax=Candidatus Magnetobacterium casense TaxID=1455061 RepID=UPI00138DDB4A|nr:M23 family metallopeptidase [Candidatus Magnetobacterium casensis]MBF0336673.1 M23 family metallopeptidase [Nitrospirota bacterium]
MRRTSDTGIDYSGFGTAVATSSGTVVVAETLSSKDHGMGNNVIIQHDNGIYSSYSHLASIDSKIKKGNTVSKGQTIGTIGGSGYGKTNYWGTHLHFEIKTCGKSSSCSNGQFWGYTSGNPDDYGYKNPANYIGSGSTPSPTISSITPTSAKLNKLTKFTVSGKNLTSGMNFSLKDCKENGKGDLGGNSSSWNFQCTPSKTGTKDGDIKDKRGKKIFTFKVKVNK